MKVIELSPPVVQSKSLRDRLSSRNSYVTAEIHDYMGAERGRQFGMPIDAFTEEAYQGILSGKDQIVIGSIGPADTFNEIIDKRRTAFENLSQLIRAHHP